MEFPRDEYRSPVAPTFPDSIFRAYDIRGVVPKTLTAETAYWIGRAIGAQSLAQDEPNVSVGRDGRLSGPGAGGAIDPGPGRQRLPCQRRRPGADPGAVLRRQRAGRQIRGDAHRQPQPVGLQRLQDRHRRRHPGQRTDPGPAHPPENQRPDQRQRQHHQGRHSAALLRRNHRRRQARRAA